MAYLTAADVRAVSGMDDLDTFPTSLIDDAIDFAEETIDEYCGTSFTYKAFTHSVDGTGRADLLLPVMFPQTITAVTVDGVSVTGFESWTLSDDGLVIRDSGYFPVPATGGQNVTISGTAGITSTAPTDIVFAARVLAVNYLLNFETRVPDRALSVQNDFGQVQLAQPGGLRRPTEFPQVNTILNRRRQRPPTAW